PSTFSFDYQVQWLNDDLDDNLLITYDKRHHITNGVGTTIVGNVEVIGDNNEATALEVKVKVLDANFNLVDEVTVNVAGSYSVSLEHWGDYYLRATLENSLSPWLKVSALQEQIEHSISLDTQQNIVDVSGTVKTQSGKTLGNVSLDFSTSALPASIYQMGNGTDPNVTTNQYGRYIISLVDQGPAADTLYDVSVSASQKQIYVDGDNQISYFPVSTGSVSLDAAQTSDADITLPDIYSLNLNTFLPNAQAVALTVDIYQVTAAQEHFLVRIKTENGQGIVNLPGKNQLGIPFIYRIRPHALTLATQQWLPPQLDDMTITADGELNITMVTQRSVTVTGQVTDVNGLVINAMDIGFTTTEIAQDDYTRAYNGYFPHQTTNVDGEFDVRLRANEGQLTTYSAQNRVRSIGARDNWAKAWNSQRWLDVWLGQLMLEQTVTLPINIENDQQSMPIQIPIAYYPVQLTVNDAAGSALPNIPVYLYYLDSDNKHQLIKQLKSNAAGQVELYMPAEQGRPADITSFQFIIAPPSSANTEVTGEIVEFNVTDQSLVLVGKVTSLDKRFVTINGSITDSHGLALQGLTLGVRTVEANQFDSHWYQTVSTDFNGAFSAVLQASRNAITPYGIRNKNRYIDSDWGWNSASYYETWASVNDGDGQYDAWVRGLTLDGLLDATENQDTAVFEHQLSFALKKASLTVLDDADEIQIGTSVSLYFKDIDDKWWPQKTLKTDATGQVAIYLTALIDERESYRWVIRPVSNN
ncbi:MAG: carboxypeptidase-like regulatory domain-containing protein, partial [Psychrosphaera sp.]|nr:carboxypeptidase-like regulatory domain-containing protein [Psychrosphaera sp.]